MLRKMLARLRSRDALILLYHRVTALANDRWSIAVTPAHFAEQMEVLRRRTTIVPLPALDSVAARPNARGGTVLVTFDDGYADNLYEALRARLREVGADEREATLDALRAAADVETSPRPDYRPLTPNELACLARDGRIAVGAHTASHARLAALPEAAQRADIETGRKALQAIIDRPVESFAYPFGRAGDYTAETMAIVREAGFTRACSNQAGRVDRSTDRFALPRLYVRDWNGDEFAAALRDHGIRV